ncbi:putative LysR-family transcriptional regulator [Ketogulonicigenium robustum]|uniref:Putative LysR-family transcriptional regulator n=1 Tax=Ketogulonicigenium robustum TaxID=92947 RepID=A0A1W6NX62_9RHOB|nr:LysR family transcriptional regulator [Ketogulonicigenium robustum]ARO13805.1 putative LysR-family transcriptional regulator [Ketogulonicigenium robustum]
MKQLTLQRIQVFCAVYQYGLLSVAARQLGISQPTASRHLRDFEASLKVPLFELRRGKLHPTREADKLFDESKTLSDSLTRLERHVSRMSDGSETRLSVATISLVAHTHMAYAMEEVLQHVPALKVSVTISLAEQQIALIREERIDLGIVAGLPEAHGLAAHRIGWFDLVALVPDEHPASNTTTLALETLGPDLPFMAMAPRGPIGAKILDAISRHGIVPDDRVSSYSLDALPHLARMRGAATIVDPFTAKNMPVPGMRVLPLREPLSIDLNVLSLAPLKEASPQMHFVHAMERALELFKP